MGRSVSYPRGASVVYAETPTNSYCASCGDYAGEGGCDCSEEDRDWREGEVDWDWVMDDHRQTLRAMFPSFWDADEWLDREDHVLARNSLVSFGVSEYCGLMSIWLVPRGDLENAGLEAFAERWIAAVLPKFRKAFGQYEKLGSMSNGEGVFRKVAA
jgi:hypothetical protein